MVVVRILVDVLDVDDVLARAGPPVEVDLPPGLGVVLEHLERVLLARGLVRTLHNLAVDSQTKDVVADAVVFRQGTRFDLDAGSGSAYDGQEQLVNCGQTLLGRGGHFVVLAGRNRLAAVSFSYLIYITICKSRDKTALNTFFFVVSTHTTRTQITKRFFSHFHKKTIGMEVSLHCPHRDGSIWCNSQND